MAEVNPKKSLAVAFTDRKPKSDTRSSIAEASLLLDALLLLGVGGSGTEYDSRREGTVVSSSGMEMTDGLRAFASSSFAWSLSMRVSSVET